MMTEGDISFDTATLEENPFTEECDSNDKEKLAELFSEMKSDTKTLKIKATVKRDVDHQNQSLQKRLAARAKKRTNKLYKADAGIKLFNTDGIEESTIMGNSMNQSAFLDQLNFTQEIKKPADSEYDSYTDYDDEDDIFEVETEIAELIGNAESQLQLELDEESKGDRLSDVQKLLREINQKHQKLTSARKEKKE